MASSKHSTSSSVKDVVSASTDKLEPLPSSETGEKLSELAEKKWLEEMTEKAQRGDKLVPS